MVGGFLVSLITSGAVWMIGSDRVLAVAVLRRRVGAVVRQSSTAKLGTPVRVNTMSGVLSTVFLLFALNLLSGSNASSFEVILALTTSTTLLSYVDDLPDAAGCCDAGGGVVHRPYRAPHDGLLRRALHRPGWCSGRGSAFVPGTIERALGFEYDYQENWGVSFARYEAISIGIVVLIGVLTAVGYILAAPVRADAVDVEVAYDAHTAPASGD